MGLDESLKSWVKIIEKYKDDNREELLGELENSSYNIKKAHTLLENYYLSLESD